MIFIKPVMIFSKLLRTHKAHNFKYYSLTLNMTQIRTFVFLDCETTGLPFYEQNQTRITEICFIGVESAHIKLGVYPRVMNKLSMCFNPQKLISPDASEITGLSNEILQYQAAFSRNTVELLNQFLDKLGKPICFVAHNGNRFDYPILKAEIDKSGCSLASDILCIDSLLAFRQLHEEEAKEHDLQNAVEREQSTVQIVVDTEQTNMPYELYDGYDQILVQAVSCLESSYSENKTENYSQKRNETTPPCTPNRFLPKAPVKKRLKTSETISVKPSTSRSLQFRQPSFKLPDLYRRLTSKEPCNTHEAEGDVRLLIHCAAVLGEKFVNWADENFKYFKDIPKMVPGKRIGT